MALVEIDPDSDPWLQEHKLCEQLLGEVIAQLDERNGLPPKGEAYANISAAIRLRIKQYSNEVTQLQVKLYGCYSVTREEKERRQRLIDFLQSQGLLLQERFNNRKQLQQQERSLLFGSSDWQEEEPSSSKPSLPDTSVDSLRRTNADIIAEQERGLENLSKVISRQKAIGGTIAKEVDMQNDLIDNIAIRVDSSNVSIQNETSDIRSIMNQDSTCRYWTVIIFLFIAIMLVVLL